MKQMTLIEMDGFLKGKCIPRDLKVNETNAEYLVRKFGELESKLETALRECHSARITIDNLEAKCAALAAENALIKSAIPEPRDIEDDNDNMDDVSLAEDFGFNHAIERMRRRIPETPATDAFLAEVKTEARKEGAYFVANRMPAAWEAGFIDDTAKNAADIARMILTSTEFMANAPEGDFDRSFSDGVLEDIAAQLRKGGNQ
ncbi:hypothetical protein JGJ96_000207 [Escherichia coli]|nr:hypothetical protein [Escherichia coli]